MTTVINSNGSKWLGQEPDTIDRLCDVLSKEPLDPTFERFGNFVMGSRHGAPKCMIRFWGNFAHVSHVFSIDTDEPQVIQRLLAHIRMNQESQAYKDTKSMRAREVKR